MSGAIHLDLPPEKPVTVRYAHAASILKFRARCARHWAPAVASGNRWHLDLSRCPLLRKTRAGCTRGSPCLRDRTGPAVARRPVDATCRSTDGADHHLGNGFAPSILAAIWVDCDHRGRSCIAGTRRVVCRCPALWMETNKNFRSQTVEVGLPRLTSAARRQVRCRKRMSRSR